MAQLRNPFWSVAIAPTGAQVVALGFDAAGRSNWCANLLKTASAAKPPHPIATVSGAQSGYFDAAGGMHLSSSHAGGDRLAAGETQLEIRGIHYGNVRESWRLRLEGRRLEWTIEQTWLADTAVADAFAPGLFFAAHARWGTATVFQLWDRDTAQDGFYGLEKAFGGTATTAASRSVRATPGGWAIAKLLSHASPNGDLRATVSHHLKKGELLNCMSLLAHTPWCEPGAEKSGAGGPPAVSRCRGDTVALTLVLEPEASETGVKLAVDLSGPLQPAAATNRRFFDTHANCAILADTHDWRFGNTPSGYVAQFCSYMYSQIASLGTPAAPLGPNVMSPGDVLAEQVGRTARHLIEHGTASAGYQADTSLDILPSFLASFRDLLLLTGDRAWATARWDGAKRATAIIAGQMEQGGGMIATARDNGNDYWDWISRNGRITSINVLAAVGLRAQARTAQWLGDAAESRRADGLADTLQDKFNAEFWSEERGCYADWIDREGQPHFFLYAGPQLQAVTAGLVPPERARRLVETIRRRRHALGPEWETCFSLQTNFYDAEAYSMMLREYKSDVTRFGQTMNGGCLVSWNFYWIGALVKAGLVDAAADAWQRVVRRFGATSLVEGCNYWDFSGKPSQTTWQEHELIAYEPFLSDQGLVSLALPRWLLGIEPSFDGIKVSPVLPANAYPARVTLTHLGRERTIEIESPARHRIIEE